MIKNDLNNILLSFIKSLATKCVSLDNEPYVIRPFLNNLNPVELKCYPFMINFQKCSGCCNCVDNLSMNIYVPSKAKNVNVKVFHMIASRNEAKTSAKHTSCDWK